MRTYEEKTKKFIEQIIALCRECKDINSTDFADIIEGAIRAAVIFGQKNRNQKTGKQEK